MYIHTYEQTRFFLSLFAKNTGDEILPSYKRGEYNTPLVCTYNPGSLLVSACIY